MDFGWALNELKSGRRVARSGWNGKGMFICKIPAGNAMFKGFPMCDCLGMKTVSDEMQPGWLASTADMLCEDWETVSELYTA